MSASEKLRALDETMPGRLIVLRNALPQIVAVVEAAENFTERSVPRHMMEYEDECVAGMDAALAALDEQLGNAGSATEPEAPTPR